MKPTETHRPGIGRIVGAVDRGIGAGHHDRGGGPDDRRRIRVRPADEERRRTGGGRPQRRRRRARQEARARRRATMPAIRSRRARWRKRSPARKSRSSPAIIARRRRSRPRKPMPTATCCRSRRPRPIRCSPSASSGTWRGSAAATTSRAWSPPTTSPRTTRARTSPSSTTRPPTARVSPTRPRRRSTRPASPKRCSKSYNKGDKDFNAIVSRLKRDNIDLVYVGGYHQEAGLILRQMRDQGLQDGADGGRRAGRQGVRLDHRPRRRRHAVHLRSRPAQQADRQGDRREVQGQEHRSRRLHALHLCRDAGLVAGRRRRPAPPIRRR